MLKTDFGFGRSYCWDSTESLHQKGFNVFELLTKSEALQIKTQEIVNSCFVFFDNYGSTQTYTKLKIYNHQTPKYSKCIWERKEN